MKNIISVSILSANFFNLESDIKNIVLSGLNYIHFDVMDGRFVENISFNHLILNTCKKNKDIIYDIHLMIEKPEDHISEYIKYHPYVVTYHYEATNKFEYIYNLLNSNNIKCGISINPSTDVSVLKELIDRELIDLILVMSVVPGKGGQKFLEESYNKIKRLKEYILKNNKNILISVDGGINSSNIKKVLNCGADIAVVGNYIFKNNKINENIENLNKIIG